MFDSNLAIFKYVREIVIVFMCVIVREIVIFRHTDYIYYIKICLPIEQLFFRRKYKEK